MGAYDDALKLLNHEYVAPPANQGEPGAVLPQANPLLLYFRGYCKSKIGQDARPDFDAASKLSPLYVFPHREIDYRVLAAAIAQNDNDAVAHDLLGELYLASLSPCPSNWRMATCLGAEQRIARSPSQSGASAAQFRKQLHCGAIRLTKRIAPLAKGPGNRSGARPRQSIAHSGGNGPAHQSSPGAPATGNSVAARSLEVPNGDVAGLALVRSVADANWASSQFTAVNFPNGKQPPFVRQAYIEVQLRGLLNQAMAKPSNCRDLIDGLENLDADQERASSDRWQFWRIHEATPLPVLHGYGGESLWRHKSRKETLGPAE